MRSAPSAPPRLPPPPPPPARLLSPPHTHPPPPTAPERAHHHADTKRNRQPCSVVPWRWVINGRVGIDGRAPDHHGIIGRHIHNLRIGLFDHDHTLALDDLGFHLLLLGRFQ